jgi:transposase-like protein
LSRYSWWREIRDGRQSLPTELDDTLTRLSMERHGVDLATHETELSRHLAAMRQEQRRAKAMDRRFARLWRRCDRTVARLWRELLDRPFFRQVSP